MQRNGEILASSGLLYQNHSEELLSLVVVPLRLEVLTGQSI